MADVEHGPKLVLCDIDDTALATRQHPEHIREQSRKDLARFGRLVAGNKQMRAERQLGALTMGPSSGRVLGDMSQLARDEPVFRDAIWRTADVVVGAVGSRIAWRQQGQGLLMRDTEWPRGVEDWRPDAIRAALEPFRWLVPQPAAAQDEFKISYNSFVTWNNQATTQVIQDALGELQANVIVSGVPGKFVFCDILPEGVDKGSSNEYVADVVEVRGGERSELIFIGDSGNDKASALVADRVIIPGNAEYSQPEFWEWAHDELSSDCTYFATEPFAAGMNEGLIEMGILDPAYEAR